MSDDVAESPAESLSAPAGDEIALGEHYRIRPGLRLPEFDLGPVEAVGVRDVRGPTEALFARICPVAPLPRLEVMAHLRHMGEADILRPLEWGPVRWPGSDRPRIAVVFNRPEHGALLPSYKATMPPMPADEIGRRVVEPATRALGYLVQRGLSHRAIRPDNMFWDGPARSSIILGDCVTTPPAMTQPTIFETVESSVTPPLGRGSGSVMDDFYALGVTVLILAMGGCPVANLDEREIVAAKMQKGSYAALMGGERPPFGLRELLRGLLADDANERWGLEELEQWLGGGLRSSVQEVRSHLAERPFKFAGVEYTNCRALAQAFGEKWEKAAATIVDPAFDKWLRRGVSDGSMAERVKEAIENEAMSGSRSAVSPRLVAQVCSILDRPGPLRYQGLVLMPTALGPVLADAFHRGDNKTIGLVNECIAKGVALDWYTAQSTRMRIVFEDRMKELRTLQQLLRHTGPGYGIERCLYMLNPHLPCWSPILKGHHVGHIKELLPTLERIVEEKGSLPALFDRHLAAFIASRIKANIDRLLAALESGKGDRQASMLGALALFAQVQAKHGPEELPALTQWLGRELEPTLERFSSRSVREQMRKRLAAASNSGNLVELNNALNNDAVARRDEANRRQAMREYAAAAREIAQLESKEFQDSTQRSGWRIASGISGLIAAGAVALVAAL